MDVNTKQKGRNIPTIKEFFEAIETERDYQKGTWPRSTALSVLGEVTLLRDYIRQFDRNYQENNDSPDYDVPFKCLHGLRKMAAILVRAMENSEALQRPDQTST